MVDSTPILSEQFIDFITGLFADSEFDDTQTQRILRKKAAKAMGWTKFPPELNNEFRTLTIALNKLRVRMDPRDTTSENSNKKRKRHDTANKKSKTVGRRGIREWCRKKYGPKWYTDDKVNRMKKARARPSSDSDL
jgi:hypothetical protein